MKRRAFLLSAIAAVFVPASAPKAAAISEPSRIVNLDAALRHYAAINDFPDGLFRNEPSSIMPGQITYVSAKWKMLP